VFALSRANVEALCDGLARRCERSQLHNPFVPHHGSISKHTREHVEERLRSEEQLTVLTTTTLGLGIDIGSVNSVELIGAPISLTALRQYIGRSGRRNAAAAVSLHVTELAQSSAIKLGDRLRLSTVRACAALNLLEQRFFEPPKDDGTTLTVVIQQVLSILKQRRGALFSQLLNLIQSVAAFGIVTEKMLRHILAHIASPDEGLIEEVSDGRYVLTEKGEKLVHGPEFYAAFRTTDQWEVVAQDERKVGFISLSNALAVGETFCLAGNRWEVTRLDLRHYRATVVPSLAGGIPIFDPMLVPEVHKQLAREMRRVLESDHVPVDLDPVAARHLQEGRSTYREFNLTERALVEDGDLVHVLSWRGTHFNKLLAEVVRAKGYMCRADEVGVTIAGSESDPIRAVFVGDLPTLDELSANVSGILNGKYDRHVPEKGLREYWATRHRQLESELTEFCRSVGEASHCSVEAKN
jgi:ATP-dependent Lhr-like helicase